MLINSDIVVVILGNGTVGSAYSRRTGWPAIDPRGKDVDVLGDAFVIAVPTPNLEGRCDASAVYDMLEQIDPNKHVLIKSTVGLEHLRYIEERHPNVTFSPEFLTEASALDDVTQERRMILGGSREETDFWTDIFLDKGYTNYARMPIMEAGFVKYTENAFLATKVSFFNEIYDLAEALGVEYEDVMLGLDMDPRIGRSHRQVPGLDGKFGWGGKCLPKDTEELTGFARSYATPLPILERVIASNRIVRDK
jgi:UDPglucose 6-dehydrogenase